MAINTKEIKKTPDKSKPVSDLTGGTPEKSKNNSKRGGHRQGAGRKAGSTNRASSNQKLNISHLARQQTDVAIKTLTDICKGGKTEAARVSAANSLLDRGYGKATQPHEHGGKGGGAIPLMDLTNATEEQLGALETFFGPLAASGADDDGDQDGAGEAED